MLQTNRRLRLGLAAVGAVLVIGSIGYVVIERMSPLDAIYFTLITISTVGFSEPIGGLSTAGRVFTIFVLVAGVGSAFYTAASGFEAMIEEVVGGGRVRRRQRRRIERMQNHIVICGYGRVGATAWAQLDPAGVIVIEADPDRADEARADGAFVVDGDAIQDSVLEQAHVRNARALIASVQSDSDNVAIVLSARALCPELLIVARANHADSTRKLELAGADRVVAPQVVGAERLAALATHPDLAEFIDIAAKGDLIEFRVEEITIDASSSVCETPIRESGLRAASGALILALKQRQKPKGDSIVLLSPSADQMLQAGDTLVVVGTAEQIRKASIYLEGTRG